MKAILGTLGLCAALYASPAMAQDGDASTGGFYAGPVVGVDDLDTGRSDGESLGVVYGGVVGYDFASNGAVFGVEGEVTDNTSHNDGSDLLVAGDSGRVSTGLDLYGGIRAGFHAGSRTLIYAKAGYTHLNVKASYTTAAGATTRVKDELGGFRFGVGAEFALTPTMALRAEYRYSDYGSVDNVGNPNLDFGIDRQQGVASVLFKF
jgi:outer membrane immunogenic protein